MLLPTIRTVRENAQHIFLHKEDVSLSDQFGIDSSFHRPTFHISLLLLFFLERASLLIACWLIVATTTMKSTGCLSEYFSQLSKSCSCDALSLERDDALVQTTSLSKSKSAESISRAPSRTSFRKKRRDGQRISWTSNPVNRWGDESNSQMARLPRSSSYDDALEIAARQKRDESQNNTSDNPPQAPHGHLTMPRRTLQDSTQAKHRSLENFGLPKLPQRRSAHQSSDNSIGSSENANFQWNTCSQPGTSTSSVSNPVPKSNPLLFDLDSSRSSNNINSSLLLSSGKKVNSNPFLASLSRQEGQYSVKSTNLANDSSETQTHDQSKDTVPLPPVNSHSLETKFEEVEVSSPKSVRPLYQDDDEASLAEGASSPLRLYAPDAGPGAPRLPSRRASIDVLDFSLTDTTETETASTEYEIKEALPAVQ